MKANGGFTRADLLAIVAVLAVLVLMAGKAVGNTRSEAQAIGCLDNHRQLTRAWLTFGADNGDVLAGGIHGGNASQPTSFSTTTYHPWATGWLSWDFSTHNTNYQYLVNPIYATLGPYVKTNAGIFRCPSDTFVSSAQRSRGWLNRVRSISMNAVVGNGSADASNGPWNPAYRKALRLSDMVYPPPSRVYVFIDEHADSINDTVFYSPYGSGPSGLTWVDLPANYHDGAAGLSFADGHGELHMWQGPVRTVKVSYLYSPPSSAQQADLRYLYDRTPRSTP
jgi:hypothetical protein